MKSATALFAVGLAPVSSGCASIISGQQEEIEVRTDPSEASCDIVRQGKTIGRVDPTPGTVLIQRSKHDLEIVCSKLEYESASMTNDSGVEGWVFGNFLFGGLIGWGIDSAQGADNSYDSPVTVVLNKKVIVAPSPLDTPDTVPPANADVPAPSS